jgi:NADH-quinone oxidoreductase subunit N
VTVGFIAKLNIFLSAISVDGYILAGIMLVTSVISYFYYFSIIRQMYMRPGETEAKISIGRAVQALVLVLFLATLLLGIFPNALLDFINNNFSFAEIFDIGQGIDFKFMR